MGCCMRIYSNTQICASLSTAMPLCASTTRCGSRATTHCLLPRTACCTSGGADSAKLLISSGAETAGQSARRGEPSSRSGA